VDHISIHLVLLFQSFVNNSAGIGRTGTYIALDTLIQEGMNDNYVDIFGRVMALRGQRGHMVQNLVSYHIFT
jgi:protein tyrosine phosphatase